MISRHHLQPTVHLGGKPAVVLFIVCLIAFVAETQLTQVVQAQLAFRQPYLIFYIVHSCFAISFPLHLLYLSVTTQHSIISLCKSVLVAAQHHLSPKSNPRVFNLSDFPIWRFLRLNLFLTAGITVPALLWFVAVALAPVTDVTALWNTNALFAYAIAVFLFGARWDTRRLIAVIIATAGAAAVVYGGSTADFDKSGPSSELPTRSSPSKEGPSAPLIGDLFTLAASIMYAAYQVLYKLYAALPNDPEIQTDSLYSPLATSADEDFDDVERASGESALLGDDTIDPLPFGLHPNLLTFGIGICTMLVFWIPIPVLDAFDIELFELPRNLITYGVIAGIALSGAVFNAGFMVLLGVWGPIVTSVGNLLSIVLVFLSDAFFGGAADTITVWSVLGCGSIVVAFAILAFDMINERR